MSTANEKRAIEEKEEKPEGQEARAATYARVVHVAAEWVRDNPWQPRVAVDQAELDELAESIYEHGLLQPPVAREMLGSGGLAYELAFGHRRVMAIRQLIGAGRWDGGVPVSVQELSDVDMALMTLAENSKRKDLTPLEQCRAYSKALAEIKDLTIQDLAKSIGVDRSTLSNHLRTLRLPAVVLERVESGEMSLHAAREFLCLMNDDHAHTDDMTRVVKLIARTSGSSGMPDWRVDHVRQQIRERVVMNEEGWRPLAGRKDDERDYTHQIVGGGGREPSFDVEAFKKDLPTRFHTIPASSGTRLWTCDVREWRRRQSAGTRERNKAETSGKGPATAGTGKPQREKAFREILAKDPVLKEIRGRVSRETHIGGAYTLGKDGELSDFEKKALGTRAELATENLEVWEYKGFARHISSPENMPPGFDAAVCQKCIAGARYGQGHRGSAVNLYCTREQCFNDTQSRGMERFGKELQQRIEKEDAADQRRAKEIAEAIGDPGLAREIATALLSVAGSVRMISPAGGSKHARFDYHPAVLIQAAEILGVTLRLDSSSWESSLNLTKALDSLEEECDSEMMPLLAGQLVTWAIRAGANAGDDQE